MVIMMMMMNIGANPMTRNDSFPKHPCQWCGSEHLCDCNERITCDKVGQPGHRYCGRHECGCPKFIYCRHLVDSENSA